MKHFSIKRTMKLLRLELMIEGKGLLTGFITMLAIILLVLLNGPDFTYEVYSRVLHSYLPFVFVGTGLAFFARIHQLLHQSAAHPFVSVPATVGEKYLFILLLGVLYFLIASVTIQINLWVEHALYPQINYHPEPSAYNDWMSSWLANDSLFLSPAALLREEVLITGIYAIGLLLLISLSFSWKIIAYPLFVIAPVGTIYLLSRLFSMLQWNLVGNENAPRFLGLEAYPLILSMIGIAALVGSYFVLRRKEVKS